MYDAANVKTSGGGTMFAGGVGGRIGAPASAAAVSVSTGGGGGMVGDGPT